MQIAQIKMLSKAKAITGAFVFPGAIGGWLCFIETAAGDREAFETARGAPRTFASLDTAMGILQEAGIEHAQITLRN